MKLPPRNQRFRRTWEPVKGQRGTPFAIEVTAEDIAAGQAWSLDRSPIALASARAFRVPPDRIRVFHGYLVLRQHKRSQDLTFKLPPEADDFTWKFNRREVLRFAETNPFTFRILIPWL